MSTAPEWKPAFEGQRPPFLPGNEANLIHGARSERRVGPLAERISLLAQWETRPGVCGRASRMPQLQRMGILRSRASTS